MALSLVQLLNRYFCAGSVVFFIITYILGIWALPIAKLHSSDKCDYDYHNHIIVTDTFKFGTENVTYSYFIEPTTYFEPILISANAVVVILFAVCSYPLYSYSNRMRVHDNEFRKGALFLMFIMFVSHMVMFMKSSHISPYYAVHDVNVPNKNITVNRNFNGQLLTLFNNDITYSQAEKQCELNKDLYHRFNTNSLNSCTYSPTKNHLQLSYYPKPSFDCNNALWEPYNSISRWSLFVGIIEILILAAWFVVHEIEKNAFVRDFIEERREVRVVRVVTETPPENITDIEQEQPDNTSEEIPLV